MNSFRKDNRTIRPSEARLSLVSRRIEQLHSARSLRHNYLILSNAIALLVLIAAVTASSVAVAYAQTPLLSQVSASHQSEVSSTFQEVAFAVHEGPGSSRGPALLARDVIAVTGRIQGVNITFYDCADQGFCGAMANGRRVYEGAAACSYNLALGTRFVIAGDPTGRVYVCEDRGLLANTWVDIFWYYPSDGYRWQSIVGRYGTIEIVQLPY